MHAPMTIVPYISIPASSDAFPTAVASPAQALPVVSFSAPIASASRPVSYAPAMAR